MLIQQRAHGPQNRKRGAGKDLVGESLCRCGTVFFKCACADIAAVVAQFRFLGAPTGLELFESPVVEVGPPEMEARKTLPRKPFYRLPHDKVVGSQVLVPLVRSAILVDGGCAKLEIEGSGDRSFSVQCPRDEPVSFRDHMFKELLKETIGLRREAVFSSGYLVQPVELLDRLLGRRDVHPDAGLCCLLDVPPGAVTEGREDRTGDWGRQNRTED
jgi:hypothetical protein